MDSDVEQVNPSRGNERNKAKFIVEGHEEYYPGTYYPNYRDYHQPHYGPINFPSYSAGGDCYTPNNLYYRRRYNNFEQRL